MRSATGQWVLFIILILYIAGTALFRFASVPNPGMPSQGLSLMGLAFDALLILALIAVWRGLAAAVPEESPSRRLLTPAFAVGALAWAALIVMRLAGPG